MTILHIDSSARLDGSVTRDLGARIVAQLGGKVIHRDLATPLPQIDGAWVGANFTAADQRSPEQAAALALSDTLINELQAADTLVLAAPMYNFGVPAALKAWIDLVARAGVTFRYTEDGPQGLLRGKRAILVLASGGTELDGPADYVSGYLRHIMGFIGITDITIVAAERTMVQGDAAMTAAHAQIADLAPVAA